MGLEGTDGGIASCGVRCVVWLTVVMILCSSDLVSQGPDVISLQSYPGHSSSPPCQLTWHSMLNKRAARWPNHSQLQMKVNEKKKKMSWHPLTTWLFAWTQHSWSDELSVEQRRGMRTCMGKSKIITSPLLKTGIYLKFLIEYDRHDPRDLSLQLFHTVPNRHV